MSLVTRIRNVMSALSGKPPSGAMPDWPAHFMGWAFALPEAHLTHVEAFYKVPIVSAAVDKLAEDQASIPRKVYRGRGKGRVEIERTGKPVELGGNLADLLYRANPLSVGSTLYAELTIGLTLAGNGYWHMQTGSPELPPAPNNLPVEIWNLPGYLTRPQPGPRRTIELFEYNKGASGAWQAIKPENVIHFRRPSAKDEPIGKSPLDAVYDTYMAQYLAGKWMREFFQKGGVIAGLWTIENGDSVRNYSEQDLNAMGERLRRQTLKPDGTADRWKAIVVQGLKFVAQGMKLSEMQLEQQLAVMDMQVARAVGVPPLMLGIKSGERELSTSSATEAMSYWLGKHKSLATLLDDTINERLAPLFGRDVYVEADFAAVPAVAALMVEQAKAQKELAGGRAIITPNEAREHPSVGLAPHADGDDLNVPPPPNLFGGLPGAGGPKDEPKPKPEPKKEARNARLSAGEGREELRAKAATAVELFQRGLERLVMSRLAEQRGETKAKLRAQVEDRLSRKVRLQTIDPRDLVGEPDDADLERAQALLERLLLARGIDAIADLEAALGVALEVAVSMNNERAAEFIRMMVERAISIPDATTRQALRSSLADGVAANETLWDLVARVDAVFDAREGQALTIVRTETAGAYNFASVEAWQQSGVVDHHEWLTSRSGLGGRHSEDPDGRYTDLDGQVRALGEPFSVGGVPMLYPGDPGAPVGETANCVCTTAPIVNMDRLAYRRLTVSFAHSRANGNGKGAAHRLTAYFTGAER